MNKKENETIKKALLSFEPEAKLLNISMDVTVDADLNRLSDLLFAIEQAVIDRTIPFSEDLANKCAALSSYSADLHYVPPQAYSLLSKVGVAQPENADLVFKTLKDATQKQGVRGHMLAIILKNIHDVMEAHPHLVTKDNCDFFYSFNPRTQEGGLKERFQAAFEGSSKRLEIQSVGIMNLYKRTQGITPEEVVLNQITIPLIWQRKKSVVP